MRSVGVHKTRTQPQQAAFERGATEQRLLTKVTVLARMLFFRKCRLALSPAILDREPTLLYSL